MKFLRKLFPFLFKKKQPATLPVVIQEPEVQLPLPIDIPLEKPVAIADFKFVDSSHHHDKFDVTKYPARFLSNKCTQGTGMIDETHAVRKKQCADHGIEYSGYHFYECRRDPILQAQFYIKNQGAFTCPPQVDFETYEDIGQNDKMLMANIEKLYIHLCEIEKITGMTPWLYINYAFAKNAKLPAKFARFPAWFARYNSTLGPIPLPWTEETTGAWQFTEAGLFPGFIGGNDVNIYYGKVNVLNLK